MSGVPELAVLPPWAPAWRLRFADFIAHRIEVLFGERAHPSQRRLHLLCEPEIKRQPDDGYTGQLMHIYLDPERNQHLGWVFLEVLNRGRSALRDAPSPVWRLDEAQKECPACSSAARVTWCFGYDPGTQHMVQCTPLCIRDFNDALQGAVKQLHKSLPPAKP